MSESIVGVHAALYCTYRHLSAQLKYLGPQASGPGIPRLRLKWSYDPSAPATSVFLQPAAVALDDSDDARRRTKGRGRRACRSQLWGQEQHSRAQPVSWEARVVVQVSARRMSIGCGHR